MRGYCKPADMVYPHSVVDWVEFSYHYTFVFEIYWQKYITVIYVLCSVRDYTWLGYIVWEAL